jgi:hypothetical protein
MGIETLADALRIEVESFDPTKRLNQESADAYLGRLVRQIIEHKGTQSAWLKVIPKWSETGHAFVVDPINTRNLAMALSGLREPQPINAPEVFAVLALDGSVLSEHAARGDADREMERHPKAVRVAPVRRVEIGPPPKSTATSKSEG